MDASPWTAKNLSDLAVTVSFVGDGPEAWAWVMSAEQKEDFPAPAGPR
jgi:hypothetical protein